MKTHAIVYELDGKRRTPLAEAARRWGMAGIITGPRVHMTKGFEHGFAFAPGIACAVVLERLLT